MGRGRGRGRGTVGVFARFDLSHGANLHGVIFTKNGITKRGAKAYRANYKNAVETLAVQKLMW